MAIVSYKTATLIRSPEGALHLALDGEPARTPGGRPFVLPTAALGAAVLEEWQAQSGAPAIKEMVFSRLAVAAIDGVGPRLEEVRRTLQAYGETDLLCYRAEQPEALRARQAAAWQPPLDWAAGALGVRLESTHTLAPIAQAPEALAALGRAIAALDPFRLAALGALAARTGSIVLALAVLHGALPAAEAFALSRLDENFEAERWGTDAQAEARARRIGEEVGKIARFLALLG